MYLNLVRFNEWLYDKMTTNLAEMNEVSIYEISCQSLNKTMIAAQDANRKRLSKFIEKHIDAISNDC